MNRMEREGDPRLARTNVILVRCWNIVMDKERSKLGEVFDMHLEFEFDI
jgi:hypothetical protein